MGVMVAALIVSVKEVVVIFLAGVAAIARLTRVSCLLSATVGVVVVKMCIIW
jgi:hypothetical protein